MLDMKGKGLSVGDIVNHANEDGECQVLSWQKAVEKIQIKRLRIKAFMGNEFRIN